RAARRRSAPDCAGDEVAHALSTAGPRGGGRDAGETVQMKSRQSGSHVDEIPGGALAADERRRITVRLGAGLVGVGLLGLGTLLIRLQPDQWEIGELCRAAAAAVVGVPTLVSGLRGVLTGDARHATDQRVAL